MPAPLDDIVAEGQRLVDEARRRDVPCSLLGGVAVRLRAASVPASLVRAYKDLDFAAAKQAGRHVTDLLTDEGYQPEVEFNALNGGQRLLFHDPSRDRQVDVFIGALRMCHEIPLSPAAGEATVPLAELLLTKLQIVELNEKDLRDTVLLLHGHEVSGADGDDINAMTVAELCGRDWGLWRTITANLDRCLARRGDYALGITDSEAVARRIGALLSHIESEPKTRGWKLRARIGERKRWYELPEEVDG